MNSCREYAAALLAIVAMCTASATAEAQNQAQNQVQRAHYNNSDASLENTFDEVLASYQCGCNDGGCSDGGGYDSGYAGCDSCYSDCGGGGGCGSGGSLFGGGNGCLQMFAGVDHLYLRANFSEAVAYTTNDTANNIFTTHQMDFDYNSSYRFYGGIRDVCCGMEIRFEYTRFNSDAAGVTLPSDSGNPNIVFDFPFDPPRTDNNITVDGSVQLNSYDLSCGKTIPLGSPLCCDTGCGDCCDTGCGNWCPAWDLTWEAGIRAADVAWQQNIVSTLNPGATSGGNSSGFNKMDFQGVGLRFGLGGRRYFGRQGLFSAYLNGDISLLVGDVELTSFDTRQDITVGSQPVNTTQRATFRNVIPVTEIEAGVTGHLSRNLSFSSGYMISAWHDLGMRQEFFSNAANGVLGINGYDDANILGFDGFFARLEGTF